MLGFSPSPCLLTARTLCKLMPRQQQNVLYCKTIDKSKRFVARMIVILLNFQSLWSILLKQSYQQRKFSMHDNFACIITDNRILLMRIVIPIPHKKTSLALLTRQPLKSVNIIVIQHVCIWCQSLNNIFCCIFLFKNMYNFLLTQRLVWEREKFGIASSEFAPC